MASDSVSLLNFRKGGQGIAREIRPRWWALEDDKRVDPKQLSTDVANSIQATVDAFQKRQDARIRQLIVAARLYGNSSLLGVSGVSGSQMVAAPGAIKERLTDNVLQSIVDTSTARIGENKPRPYFLTDGGTYKLQRQAKKLNEFTQGLFYETKAYRLGSNAQRDAEVFGDGLIFVTKKHDRVALERVLSAEVWIDEAEGVYGKPRQLHWVRAVDREELVQWVKNGQDGAELRRTLEAIYDATRAPLLTEGSPSVQADMVTVRESWHLRSGPTAKDGKHCISIDGHLIDPLTDWPHDFFPFARWQWCPRPMGYWSQGLCEQLQNKQLEVNKLLWFMQRSMQMAGTYKVLLENGSKIVSEHLNNEIGAIVKYTGTKPDWFVPNVVPPEYYQQYERIVETMYQRAGVPLQVATGQKPAGLNSGEAQRVYRDSTNEAMKTKEALNEDAFMDLARIAIAMAREIAEETGKGYEVRSPSGRILKTIRLTAKELDPSAWEMQCFPTSSLPKDPAGRLATIQEYIQAGFMSPRQGRRALDFPDLEAVESLANAAEDLVAMLLDGICDDGEYNPPEPTDNLGMAKEMVVEYINRGRAQGLEEDRMDMLRTFSVQVDALMQAGTPPPVSPPGLPPGAAAPPGMGGPGPLALGPGGPPVAPPMPMAPSPLVPNVPAQ